MFEELRRLLKILEEAKDYKNNCIHMELGFYKGTIIGIYWALESLLNENTHHNNQLS